MFKRLLIGLMRVLLSLFILLGMQANDIAAQGQANEAPKETMEAGNRLYDEGRFAEAALTYEGLVSQGVRDGRLFFNLANAYYKENDLGRAILNYERAVLLIPRDSDLRANLRLANSQAADRYEAQRESLIGQAALTTSRWLTLNEMALLGLCSWFVVVLLWIVLNRYVSASPRLREITWYGVILTALVLVSSVLLLGVRVYADQTRPQGILLASEVDVLSGPNPNNITEFTLHAGAKITILETRGQWLRLALPGDELQGWVPAETVGLVQITDSG
ncbi:MAG: hypothetical protein AAF702_31040 [Chloroflexota bacterium]